MGCRWGGGRRRGEWGGQEAGSEVLASYIPFRIRKPPRPHYGRTDDTQEYWIYIRLSYIWAEEQCLCETRQKNQTEKKKKKSFHIFLIIRSAPFAAGNSCRFTRGRKKKKKNRDTRRLDSVSLWLKQSHKKNNKKKKHPLQNQIHQFIQPTGSSSRDGSVLGGAD